MRYILGLDISTSVIGIAVMNDESELVHYDNIKMNSKDDLEKRAKLFQDKISDLKYAFESVYIEQPAMMFGGGRTTAQTMSKLQRFNGMCCYAVYSELDLIPVLVHANSARKKMNISVPRNVKNKKAFIVERVQEKYPSFKYEVTRYGNPKPGTDDIADAIVIAHYGIKNYLEGEHANGENQNSK